MGGCVSSRTEFPNNVHPNIFTVYPVTRSASVDAIETSSDGGLVSVGRSARATGQLEVSGTELVLHRRGHDPVRWPLQYVRRYGYENNLFSFESGRRCESGPGIFTFRCRRARDLFHLVQTNVQEARTPAATPQQRLMASGDSGLRTLERDRSGSVASQTRSGDGGRANGNEIHALVGRRLDSTASDPMAAGFATFPVTGLRLVANERNGEYEMTGGDQTEDTDAGQVFLDVAAGPSVSSELSQLRLQQHHRLTGTGRSQASSASSDRSLPRPIREQQRQSFRQRPASFEFGCSPASSSPHDGGDSSAFVSPGASAQSPATPPSTAYYVNIDPSTGQHRFPSAPNRRQREEIYQNKILSNLKRAPGRSQSLGSSSPPIEERQSKRFVTSKTCDLSNVVKSNSASPSFKKYPATNAGDGGGPLHYITVDVRRTRPVFASGRNTWTSSTPTSFGKRYHKRHWSQGEPIQASEVAIAEEQSLASQSDGGNNSRKGTPAGTDAGQQQIPPVVDGPRIQPVISSQSSNYTQIDCARTRALRETAAAAQMQRRTASCSATASEVVEITPTLVGRWKRDGVSSLFGRRKHHSGSVDRKFES